MDPKPGGKVPDRKIEERSSLVRLLNIENEAGIEPVKKFLEISRTDNSFNCPKLDEMLPVRLLLERYKCLSLPKFPSVLGTAPFTAQYRRSSTWRAARRDPNQSGMGPGNKNPEALKVSRWVRLARASTANCGFIRPSRVRLRPETFSVVTRPFWHRIPFHFRHGSSFLGQSRARRPREDLSWNNADNSVVELRVVWAVAHRIKNKIRNTTTRARHARMADDDSFEDVDAAAFMAAAVDVGGSRWPSSCPCCFLGTSSSTKMLLLLLLLPPLLLLSPPPCS